MKNDAGIEGQKDAKASWVNLFKDNREFNEDIKLQAFDNQSDEVVLCESDAQNIEEAWGYGLVGYFAGRFPGKVALLQLCDSWKVKYQYFVHSSGWLVCKFETDSERLSVLHGGPYFVFGRPLMLKAMPRYFEFDDKEVSTMPVWINLPGLPLEFWNKNALGKIVSKVGKPISTDKLTSTRGRLSYARALVEVDASIELVRVVKIKLPNGKLREQEIIFEHEPKFCGSCKVFGHTTHGCTYKKYAAKDVGVSGKSSDRNSTKTPTAAKEVQTDLEVCEMEIREKLEEPFIEVANRKSKTQPKGQHAGTQNQQCAGTAKGRQPGQHPESGKACDGPSAEPVCDGQITKTDCNGKLKGKLDEQRATATKKDVKRGNSLVISS